VSPPFDQLKLLNGTIKHKRKFPGSPCFCHSSECADPS
jgi:hypothetical protein